MGDQRMKLIRRAATLSIIENETKRNFGKPMRIKLQQSTLEQIKTWTMAENLDMETERRISERSPEGHQLKQEPMAGRACVT